MCSDFQFSLCVDTFSLNLGSSPCVFVHDRHFFVLFWAVNFMVCALFRTRSKLFVLCVYVYLWLSVLGLILRFWLSISFVNVILFVTLPLCGYFYLYNVASFHLKFVRFTSLWMQLMSRTNPGCFGRETITFAFKHGRKDRGRW